MTESLLEADIRDADILIVDDMPENLRILMGMLSTCGCRVRPAPSGALALQAAREEAPDLILLDIQMPGMDGYEVCRALKGDPRLAQVPVIFLSAFTDAASKVKAFEAGGIDYVSKPFSVEEVLARVGTQLKLVREQRERRRSYEKLQDLERLRDGLVHMLVHDLRSPLLALDLFLPALKDHIWTGLAPDYRNNLDEALRVVQRLIQMVNAMLDVSKLEAGEMQLSRTDCELGALAGEVLASQQILARSRRVILDAPEPVTAPADRDLLFRVFQNLVGNALKYTPASGQIRVSIRQEGPWACARVQDQGPGIPKRLQARAFEKFGQVDPTQRHGFSTGLGLPFCRLAVEAHGGTLGLESEEGEGCCFWLKLPC